MCFNAGCTLVLEKDSHSILRWLKIILKEWQYLYYFSLLFGYLSPFPGVYALHMYDFIQLRKKCFRMQNLSQTWRKLLLDYLFFSMQLETGC